MMEWQWTPYTVPFVGVGLASVLMAVYIGRQRSLPVVKSKRMLLAVGAIWIWGYAFELAAAKAGVKQIAALIQTIGFAFTPVAFLFYAARYAGNDRWMKPRSFLLVAIIPGLTILLTLTNDFHKLILSDYSLATNGQFVYMVRRWGPAFWGYLAYAGAIMLMAVTWLIKNALQSGTMYVWQTVSFVVGAVVTLILSLMDALGLYLVPGLQLSALAVNVFSVIIGAYLIPLRRGEARAASYAAAFNDLLDPIVVVDARGEILDLNAAACKWILPQAARGPHRVAARLPVELAGAIARLLADPLARQEIAVISAGESLTYEIRSSPLKDGAGRIISHILIFHDVTSRVRELNERRQAEGLIQASLREKEVLLKEIHHRVKNNLQVISSLLALQAKQVCGNPEAEGALRESQQRVRSMSLIHEKLYQSKSLAEINLADYIRHLATSIVQSYEHGVEVDLRLGLEPVVLGIDQAVPCGLILNELITNALKYAFPGGRRGILWIDLRGESGQQIQLRVADDGPGLPPDLDIHQAPSLGMQLVVGLTTQLRGTLEVATGRGAEFRIVFPPGA